MKYQYPILIEPGTDTEAWGVIIPDLPGCFSAADNEADILSNTREAILLHLEQMDHIPTPSSLGSYREKAGDKFILSIIDVDLSLIDGPAKRINITVPAGALARIDVAAKLKGKTRSAFLTEAGINAS